MGMFLNYHNIDSATCGKLINLIQIRAVIDKETSLFAVMLHKVVGGDFKGFLYTLTDSNTRHNNDKLAPAVFFVQLKHRLDIHICRQWNDWYSVSRQ